MSAKHLKRVARNSLILFGIIAPTLFAIFATLNWAVVFTGGFAEALRTVGPELLVFVALASILGGASLTRMLRAYEATA